MPAIAFKFPEEIAALRDGITAFIRAEVLPRHQKNAAMFEDLHEVYTRQGAYRPHILDMIREVRMASARAGYFGLAAPEALGGSGLGYLAYAAAWERVFHECGAQYWLGHYMISHWAKGPSPVLAGLTPAYRDKVVPRLASGEHSMCFALSEPGAGSDAMMIKTRADRDGDGWRLNGTKIWTSNSPHAEYAIVFAVTDQESASRRKGGISAFFVPLDSPGFSIDRLINMWGRVGTDEAMLRFENVRLEPEQLVGELNRGFAISMLGVGLGRVYNSSRAVGFARWALEKAFDYAKVRETFGKKISEYQGVTFPLAESAMHVHAAHLMVLNVCQLLDQGLPATKELSMTKAFCVETSKTAIDRAMQTHGAMGFTNELYLTDAYISMRRTNVADGTAEIMRRTIVKQMLIGDTEL